jgi:hypothetical protein
MSIYYIVVAELGFYFMSIMSFLFSHAAIDHYPNDDTAHNRAHCCYDNHDGLVRFSLTATQLGFILVLQFYPILVAESIHRQCSSTLNWQVDGALRTPTLLVPHSQ